MSYYRLLFKKAAEGPVIGIEEIRARDDVEAVRVARQRLGAETVEVWCDKRKVKNLAPAHKSAFAF